MSKQITDGILGYDTGNSNTLSAKEINVLLFTCVLVSFLSRLKGTGMKRRRFRVTSLTI